MLHNMYSLTFSIPSNYKILVLEDSAERISWFRQNLGCTLQTLVDTANDAMHMLANHKYNAIFLDHDLGLLQMVGCNGCKAGPEGTGLDVANYLARCGYLAELVVIHSWNPSGAKNMKDVLPNAIVIPFGKFSVRLV